MTSSVKPNGQQLRGFQIRVGQALVKRHRADYEIGRLIDEAVDGAYYRFWPYTAPDGKERRGYPSFNSWCQDVFGFTERKAYTLKANYLHIDRIELDENGPTFSRLLRLGWTKVEQVLKAARSEDDVLSWLEKIEDEGWSFKKLYGEVEAALSGYERPADGSVPPLDEEDDDEDPIIAVYESPDDEDDDEDDEDSLNIRRPIHRRRPDRTGTTRIPLRAMFTSRESYDIYTKALEYVQEQFSGMGEGEAIALMATDYMANSAREDEGGPAVTLEYKIRAIEQTYGVKLKVDDEES